MLGIVLVVLVAGVLLLLPWVIRTYNGLVRGRNKVREVWANIEVQINRRHELIPNLVSTVKGYATHENAVLTQVTQARSSAVAAKSPAEHAQAEQLLMTGLMSLYAVAEAYPELRASGNFTSLQTELSQIENAIQESRTAYNGIVSRFNTAVQSFPTNLIAGLMGFKQVEFYDAPEQASSVPSASF